MGAGVKIGSPLPTISAVEKALPEVKEIVYMGTPGTENYVDLSGTIWQVDISNNVPLNNPRGFKKIAAFFDGGNTWTKKHQL